ncbi:hypothetical protein AMTR_s00087p00019180 [Amborella trichopoda]|uniref:Uncharacterized protein n=1 Tax=Amborella trichopoda TaxID=13333 RepID=W1P6E6_AMBTC|nr:hypothetical protein AMTR_s00087p00019180 [Amborella trichopoda]
MCGQLGFLVAASIAGVACFRSTFRLIQDIHLPEWHFDEAIGFSSGLPERHVLMAFHCIMVTLRDNEREHACGHSCEVFPHARMLIISRGYSFRLLIEFIPTLALLSLDS